MNKWAEEEKKRESVELTVMYDFYPHHIVYNIFQYAKLVFIGNL